ncbi:adenylyltransferase/sulfurtransferase MoeZ [Tersicoccus solisilvae]|uniref:Adenylyltransferase/sulfurtransferase MoeZ n=1 Tax=Tersicoccus solisilvae TaxID=1882339 RepID=A0ABQ1NPC6_9MICC|nr:molybdopterin-synthase adenylyltransferase MoeB [Tersicoccus solisilvae]GGC82119.1 adenylyltransferase/sulfurtransferase MoeZ [Tersicoccus solisilvae]
MTTPTPLPPLVEAGEPLTVEERERYARQLILPGIGVEGQRRLKNARVLVVGAGGLGSPVLLYLAAAGVGTIGVVDDDVVDTSNLQRQVIHRVPDVGRAKVDSAVDAITALNPLVTVVAHRRRLTADTAAALLAGYDLVVDGADNFATRYLVSDAAELAGLPVVWGSLLRFDGQVAVFWGRHGPTYRDLFPVPPAPGSVPDCATAGVFGALCAAIGSMMATEAIKLVTGAGTTLLGRVLVLDALGSVWRELPLAADPGRAPVTTLTAGSAESGDGPAAPVITATDLAALLADRAAGRADVDLIDVREAHEAAVVAIDGARLVPMEELLSDRVRVDPGRPVVLHCQGGTRSAVVARHLIAAGHRNVRHLEGGILAWVRDGAADGNTAAPSVVARGSAKAAPDQQEAPCTSI